MSFPLRAIGRTVVILLAVVGGTALMAAPAIAGPQVGVHAAYGDNPYGGEPGSQSEDPYETTVTSEPTTTTTTAQITSTTIAAAPVEDPQVGGAALETEAPAAVVTRPVVLESLPRTGSRALHEAFLALGLVVAGIALRAPARRQARR